MTTVPTYHNPYHKITKEERLAFKEFTSKKHIAIKPADEGDTVVVMNITDCISNRLR